MLNLTQLLSTTNLTYPPLRFDPTAPPIIVWNLTKSCNLNCLFCYYDAKVGSKEEVNDWTLAKQIVKQLKEARIKFLLLSGGEPLLYTRFLDLLTELNHSSIRVGISTNGTLINQELASTLKKKEVAYVGISLDGLKETHNRLRNSSFAFAQALNGLRFAQEEGLKTGIRLTLNAYNYRQVKEIFSLAEGLKVNRFCFYHLVYAGRAKAHGYDLSLKERERTTELIIKLTSDWIRRKIPTEVLSVDNFSDGLIILKYLKKKKAKNYNLVKQCLERQGGCRAGKKILNIDHLGYLHPCQFWQEERLADLRKESLSAVLNNGKLKLFDAWKMRLKGKCASCAFKESCGGCRVRAYQRYGDFWQEDPICYLEENATNILEHN